MTVTHHVRVYRSDEDLAREDQLAYKHRRKSPPTRSPSTTTSST